MQIVNRVGRGRHYSQPGVFILSLHLGRGFKHLIPNVCGCLHVGKAQKRHIEQRSAVREQGVFRVGHETGHLNNTGFQSVQNTGLAIQRIAIINVKFQTAIGQLLQIIKVLSQNASGRLGVVQFDSDIVNLIIGGRGGLQCAGIAGQAGIAMIGGWFRATGRQAQHHCQGQEQRKDFFHCGFHCFSSF